MHHVLSCATHCAEFSCVLRVSVSYAICYIGQLLALLLSLSNEMNVSHFSLVQKKLVCGFSHRFTY